MMVKVNQIKNWPAAFIEGSRIDGSAHLISRLSEDEFELLTISLEDFSDPENLLVSIVDRDHVAQILGDSSHVEFSTVPEFLEDHLKKYPTIQVCRAQLELRKLREFSNNARNGLDVNWKREDTIRIIENIVGAQSEHT